MANALQAEIATDPLGRGYSGMTFEQQVTSLKTVNRTKPRTTVSGRLVWRRINMTEYAAIVADEAAVAKNRALSHLVSLLAGDIEIDDANIAALVTNVFGAGSQTIRNLVGHAQADNGWKGNDLRSEPASRLVELGYSDSMTAEQIYTELKRAS